jgi:hypothetical protein
MVSRGRGRQATCGGEDRQARICRPSPLAAPGTGRLAGPLDFRDVLFAACANSKLHPLQAPAGRRAAFSSATARRSADCQCGELIDRIAASASVRKLFFVEALGHARVPFTGGRPDHPRWRCATSPASISAGTGSEPSERNGNKIPSNRRFLHAI